MEHSANERPLQLQHFNRAGARSHLGAFPRNSFQANSQGGVKQVDAVMPCAMHPSSSPLTDTDLPWRSDVRGSSVFILTADAVSISSPPSGALQAAAMASPQRVEKLCAVSVLFVLNATRFWLWNPGCSLQGSRAQWAQGAFPLAVRVHSGLGLGAFR